MRQEQGNQSSSNFSGNSLFILYDSIRWEEKALYEAAKKKGVDVNATGMHAMKPIMSAAEGGDLETVKYLASKGADVNAHNNSGSALMWAIEADEPRIVEFLLMNGADPTWRNSLGRTALDLAMEKQAKGMIDLIEAALKKTSKAHKPSR